MIRPEDDFFHSRTDDPHWNESGFFNICIPERELSGAVYVHHRPNRAYVWAGLVLWDPTGEQVYDCLWHDFTVHPLSPETVKEGQGVFDFRLDSGLNLETIDPLKSYRFTYDSFGCKAELAWQNVMEPHDSHGFPDGWDDWGANHYEQAGRMTGTIELDGESMEVDSFSIRDRSWGPHRQSKLVRGDFPWAIAAEDHAFVVHSVGDRPPDDDPVIGTAEPIGTGFYLKDGKVGTLVSGERRAEERGDDGRPLVVTIDAEDEHGRRLEAEGRCANWLHFTSFGQSFWWWSLAEWRFDGATGWGEDVDFYAAPQSRRFIRSLTAGRPEQPAAAGS